MHIGKSYSLPEFVVWTRRQLYLLLLVALAPVCLYQVLGLTWLTIPLTVVALLGTATSFIVGFKNVQTYSRTLEAQQIVTSTLASSRFWGCLARDYPSQPQAARDLIHRHFAWWTALRYQLRSARLWETADAVSNVEYRRFYRIPERELPLESALAGYLSTDELTQVLAARNRATCVLSLQARALKALLDAGQLSPSLHLELMKIVKEFQEQQAKLERIKNFPYPRQYAVINTFFVRAFCVLLPFGLLKEFDKLNDGVAGVMQGHMIWLLVPFSVMISWMYTSLEKVGESTENPFEGSANDLPITHLGALIEYDVRETVGETGLPALAEPGNGIVL